ncbi:TonB-dependent receptor domain-containing protein [Parerythrobacter jejuensis]|uniref:TonB-dependent receptor n=1 Tax=Parerythrobacter jejuensis TaxID=795812 RepID=A0A845ARM9_9SPHN|nr:TonB-dependent receptor [Parerythrobacter jejuensis]MXP31575.1 TonB-dependent receptor [Parerythrobacter jejuensis]
MNTTRLSTRRGKSGLFAGAGIAALSLAVVATPAYAQDQDADPEAEQSSEDDDSQATASSDSGMIIVSGSRIARPNLDSTVPVTSVEAEELLDDGSISLGDALNDLPSLRSTFSTSNSQRFIGTTGLNILDLRGLGTTRTLTLVNGRRHITASAGDFQVDVNTIPFELLERVDVVTGGSSAVYGSDAIAGVVNFILRRDYDGFEMNGQAGISERGDNARYSIGATFGRNFADGRGNIAVSAEYTNITRVLNSQRPDISGFGIGFTAFEQTDDLSDEGLSNSDGIPDSVLTNNLFLDFISEGGTVQAFCIFGQAVQPLSCGPNGTVAAHRFGPDGRLFREDNNRLPSGRAIGGTGTALSDGTLIPDIERYNLNILTHFDISDAFRPYAEFKYARIEALGQGTPTFFNSFCGGLSGASGLDPSCADGATSSFFFVNFDNPFINPADVGTLRQIQDELLQGFGFPPGVGGAASQGFFINRNNSDFGTRNDQLKRETYRVVVGVEGDISSNTRYDLSFNYGRFESNLSAQNQLIYQNTRNAVDAVRNGAGQIVCRINADADPTNDDPACIPINVIGAGGPSQAALDYINANASLDEKAEQFNVLGYIGTDSSPFFELPGGPIRLVAGFEWRREEAQQIPDPLSASGATFFNAFSDFTPPALEVLEGFGEIEFPLLANVPFAEELTFSAAGRISDYNSGGGLTGTVEAYNLNAVWAPVSDIRFRANFSRAVRSPTLSNLFSPATENFLFLTDPCDTRFINNGTANRATNCAADGVPVGFTDPVTGNRSVNQGGNPFLQAEVSDSLTIGAVIEPRWIPGLSITVDYYDIEVESVIANISGNQILANCYDAPTLNNNFCPLIAPRNADGSLRNVGALNIAPVNFASLTAEGIDFDVRYAKTFDNDDRLDLRLIATHTLDRTNFLDIDNPDLPNRVRGELGDPEWAMNFNASYRKGAVTFAYSFRWVDKQTIGAYENYFPFQGECPVSGVIPRTNGAPTCTPGDILTLPPLNPDSTAEVFYPARGYHDIRVSWNINDEFVFYAGVDNITDKLPPFQLSGAGGGSGIFDNTGRYYFAGFQAEF